MELGVHLVWSQSVHVVSRQLLYINQADNCWQRYYGNVLTDLLHIFLG
jgi:hypothetical protein